MKAKPIDIVSVLVIVYQFKMVSIMTVEIWIQAPVDLILDFLFLFYYLLDRLYLLYYI